LEQSGLRICTFRHCWLASNSAQSLGYRKNAGQMQHQHRQKTTSVIFCIIVLLHVGFQLPAKQVKPPKYPATRKRPNFIYILVDDQG
jgi:hypothetical protein